MPRFSSSFRTTGAGSTTLPLASIYGIAGIGGWLREVGVFNTTATAVAVGLARLTTAGTQGAGKTEAEDDPDGNAASCTVFDTHTGGPTISDELRRATLAAAVGSGVIWTFGDTGIKIPTGTGNGIGIIITVGTGQICDVYLTWQE